MRVPIAALVVAFVSGPQAVRQGRGGFTPAAVPPPGPAAAAHARNGG